MTDLTLWAWFECYIVPVVFFPDRYRDHPKGGYFRFKLRAKRCDRPCNLLPGSPADLSLKHTLSRDLNKETDFGLMIQ